MKYCTTQSLLEIDSRMETEAWSVINYPEYGFKFSIPQKCDFYHNISTLKTQKMLSKSTKS